MPKNKENIGNRYRIRKRSIISIVITIAIFLTIILSGPAKAFVLNIDLDKSIVIRGASVIFNVSIDINSNENYLIEKLIFQLSGPENISCEFYTNGTIIDRDKCRGILIKELTNDYDKYDYGYGYNFGYGYGYGNRQDLKYKITLTTTSYDPGVYDNKIIVITSNNNFSQSSEQLTIRPFQGGSGYVIDNPTPKECSNNWTCTSWSVCSNSIKTRTCVRTRFDCTAPKPSEISSCSIEDMNITETNSNNTNNTSNNTDSENNGNPNVNTNSGLGYSSSSSGSSYYNSASTNYTKNTPVNGTASFVKNLESNSTSENINTTAPITGSSIGDRKISMTLPIVLFILIILLLIIILILRRIS